MAHKDNDFALMRMPALAWAALMLLVVDTILLVLVVRSLTAPTRAVSTSLSAPATPGAALALILPTRDRRTPWPTKTPTPTVTPWLALPTTPEPRPTIPELAQSAALPQSTPEPTTSWQPPSVPVGAPPTDAGAGPFGETPEPSDTPELSEMPAGDFTEVPVPDPEQQMALPPAAPVTFDDLPDFETFLRENRSTIAGQPLDIVSLTVDVTDPAIPRFVLEVAGSKTNNVLADQPAANLFDFGRQLLDDIKSYLGGPYCAIAVESTYETANGDACSAAPAWCRAGAYDPATNTRTVTWTYVRGSYTGGPEDVIETWNAGP